MKKIIIAFILLLALILTGCNGSEGTGSVTTTSDPNVTDAPETDPTPAETLPDATTEGTPEVTPEESVPETDLEDVVTTPSDVTTTPATPDIEPEVKEQLMTVNYVIGSIKGQTGVDMGHAGRFKTPDYIKISDIQAVAITGDYLISWFAYDKDYKYLGNGSNTYPAMPSAGVWLGVGEDAVMSDILEWNPNTVYIKFAVKKSSNANVSLDFDVANSQIKIYVSGYTRDSDLPGLDRVGKIAGSRQDGAVYGEYLFSLNGSGVCSVYSINGYQLVSEFNLDKKDLVLPHSNAVCFGTEKYAETDEFPLLYSNVYNTYPNDRNYDGTCLVYRIQRNGTTFTSTLVQIIKVGFTNDTEKWSSPTGDVRPYGNFVIDTDNNKLYAFTMRDAGKTTKFFAFNLPKVSAGTLDATIGVNKVTLGVNDIVDSFETVYFNYVQGACYYGGKIYSLEGFTDNATNRPALRIVDLKTKTVETIDLYGMNLKVEPEIVYVYNGVGYYVDVSGNVYEFEIK